MTIPLIVYVSGTLLTLLEFGIYGVPIDTLAPSQTEKGAAAVVLSVCWPSFVLFALIHLTMECERREVRQLVDHQNRRG